jgi:hypothetical protein
VEDYAPMNSDVQVKDELVGRNAIGEFVRGFVVLVEPNDDSVTVEFLEVPSAVTGNVEGSRPPL